jgi:hemerythrin
MPRVLWSDDLATGIDSIDAQHRRIVDLLNALQDRLEQGELVLARDVLRELVEYKVYHCAHEEDLLKRTGYPLLKQHKRAHSAFLKQCAAYHQQAGLDGRATREALAFLKGWMLKHIRGEDIDYANYVSHAGNSSLHDTPGLPWHRRILNRFLPRLGE